MANQELNNAEVQETEHETVTPLDHFNNAFDEVFKYIKLPEDTQRALKATTLIKGGTSILVGLPGTAKTTLIEMLAKVFNIKMAKITCAPQKVTLEGSFYRLDIPSLMKGEEKIIWKDIADADFIFISEINRAPQSFQDELIDLLQYRELEAYGEVKTIKPNALGFLDMNWYRGGLDKAISDRPRTMIPFPSPDFFARMNISQKRFNKQSITDLRQKVVPKATLDDLIACQEEVEKIEIDDNALLYATLITESFSACLYNRDHASERWIPPCFEDQLEVLGEIDTNLTPKCSYLGEICSCVKTPMAYRLDESLILLAKSLAYLDGQSVVFQDEEFGHVTEALKYVVGNRLELRVSIAKHWVNASDWVTNELYNYLNKNKLKQWATAIECFITASEGTPKYTQHQIDRAKTQLHTFANKNLELRPLALAVGITEFKKKKYGKDEVEDD